jgi:diguanylate cyclase (GGDEF)-like protein
MRKLPFPSAPREGETPNGDEVRSKDNEGLWDWNLVTNRIHFSPRWLALMGCGDHEASQTPEMWLERVHPEDLSDLLSEIETVRANGGEFVSRHRLRHQDGLYRWMVCRGTAENDHRRATRLKGAHWDVTVESVTDPLTRLPNRVLFADRVADAIARAQRHPGLLFAVLLLDVRPIGIVEPPESNPTAPLLAAVARRLETCLHIRGAAFTNDVVARLDGNRFAILLEGLKEIDDAKVVADRIVSEVRVPFQRRDRQIFLSASMGIAVSATGYARVDEMLRDAETASNRARVLGGSQSEFFDTATLKSDQTQRQLEADLKNALERGEFQLVYQPIVALASHEMVGVEALIRWHHPRLGVISPLDFIPAAERNGLIVPLGRWVIREACLRLKTWRDSFPHAADLGLSINLSGMQLKHPGLPEEIGEALRDAALDGRSLMLELTECVAIDNPTASKSVLMELRAMGIRIGIDDFGTGYSSLAYLRQLPVDALKVDRSFVHDMEKNNDAAALLGTVTGMARQLGLDVVVEGIENVEQLAILQGLQCQSAQGFLFCPPLDVDTFTGLLKTGLKLEPGAAADDPPAIISTQRDQELRPVARGGQSAPRRWSSIVAALVLLALAGVVAPFTLGVRRSVPSSSLPPGKGGDAPADAESQPARNDAPTVRAMPSVSAVSEAAGARPASPASRGVVTPAPASQSRQDPQPARHQLPGQKLTSLRVEHLHRLGNCRGRLVASSLALTFIPDEPQSNDAFSLTPGQFLSSLADKTLTIKSNTKTYRFRTAAVLGQSDDPSLLPAFVANMERFR